MADHLTPEARSKNMGRIRNKDTLPERTVRSLLHRMGFRFRLHRSDLPGNPDVVLPKYRTVVFIHGCYWHRHAACRRGQSTPSVNTAFWETKFRKNRERDDNAICALTSKGWKVIIVWECETRRTKLPELESRLRTLLLETQF